MSRNRILLIAFILVALVQLYVPAKMILDKEGVLRSGTEYKFRTAPIDPSDPFRGKYITLDHDGTIVSVQDEQDWVEGEEVYVSLSTGEDGFASIGSISKGKPSGDRDFVRATVGYVSSDSSNRVTIEYPFDRYYMEESKAYDAELVYRESQGDTTQVTYALVSVKEGEAVLKEVYINGIPIREIVKNRLESK